MSYQLSVYISEEITVVFVKSNRYSGWYNCDEFYMARKRQCWESICDHQEPTWKEVEQSQLTENTNVICQKKVPLIICDIKFLDKISHLIMTRKRAKPQVCGLYLTVFLKEHRVKGLSSVQNTMYQASRLYPQFFFHVNWKYKIYDHPAVRQQNWDKKPMSPPSDTEI